MIGLGLGFKLRVSRVALGLAGIAFVALVAGLSGAERADAITRQFDYSGQVHEWTVPPGVSSIQMTVAGAQGGRALGAVAWGSGGVVSTSTPVVQGQKFAVAVGGMGINDTAYAAFGGGGAGGRGGGGGSFVFRSLDGGATWSPFVIAGGGGGNFGGTLEAGDGGFANGTPDGQDGAGDPLFFGQGATSSGPGILASPGSPSPASYASGEFFPGEGGGATIEDMSSAGGGGGGGYYGGGGGRTQHTTELNIGSGGGGSGYLHPDLDITPTGTNDADGYVRFEYDRGASLTTAMKPALKTVRAGKAHTFAVKIRNRGGAVAENVKVCIKLPKGKKAKLVGKKCRTKKRVVAGSTWKVNFKVRKTAKGKQAKLAYKVTADGLPSLSTKSVLRRK